MRNEDLLKLKIDIRVNDNVTYQEIALLLDKPDFLQILSLLRETYKVTKFVGLNEYHDHSYEFIFKMHLHDKGTIHLDKYKRMGELRKRFPDRFKFLDESETMPFPDRLDAECNLICFEFNRPYFFTEVIRQAMFCSVVDDTYFWATQTTVIDGLEMAPWEYSLPQAAILVSPVSNYESVKKAFREAKELIQTDKRLSYYQPRTDTVSNIKKYRHWYWERVKGKIYSQISNDWTDEHPDDEPAMDENFVLKGVKKYKQLLTL